ncbi:Protein FAR1-RELATED SEQUENCE 5 [Glycine soja]
MYIDEDQWTYDNTMSQEVDMDYENEQEYGVNEPPHFDCSEAFNTSQVFGTRDDVLLWARSVALENEFVAIITRSSTHTGSRGRTSFVLIACERSGQDIGSRKCGCSFKLRGKLVHGGKGWMVKLICGIHNHELAKTLVGHPYVGQLTKDEKNIIVDITKSMVKPRNILLTLKEHNANSCTTIKQICNARSAYRSSIRGTDTEMQHLMKLLERDQYIHWHRLKDEVVVCDLFWCHPDAMKLNNACHLVFFIDSTYKTNRYKLPLLDFVGMTPTGMTFFARFAYMEGERINNVVWALERGDRFPIVIVTDRDLTLMNAIKTVFPECTNLLCRFHIDKNYVMDNWGTLVDMCSVWNAMNNMIMLQHTQIKASFETSTHVVGHVFKKTLYKRLLGMVSRYALNEIATEFKHVHYAGNNPSSYGCVMRNTHGLPCACELSRYAVGSIPLDSIHMFGGDLVFQTKGYVRPKSPSRKRSRPYVKDLRNLMLVVKLLSRVNFEKLHTLIKTLCVLLYQRSTLKRDPSYWEYVDAFHSVQSSNSLVKHSASSSDPQKPPNPTRIISMLDQFELFIQGFSHDIVDVKADGMGEDSWSLVRNKLIKELGKWSHDYINLFGGTERFEELRLSLLVDGFSKVSVDKWMDITEMGYVISSRYNVILVSLSRQQSMTFFPLRSQPPPDSSMHRMMCQSRVYLTDHCPLPPLALLWSRNCQPRANGVYFQTSTPVAIRVPNTCDFATLKTRIHNTLQLTNKQFLDEIYYRQSFTDTGNQICFQCMQLKNDDDVNTMLMLMCNHQFSCVGPIELLCTIGRTPDGILNLLEGTMTPTHDVLLYYNGRWNMPLQNNFVGYAFTGKNPKKIDIPSGCTIDELKDLIKQVAPQGILPHGIHISQMVRRLFFQQPGHFEYSDKVIKFKIIELKTNNDVLKVMEMEDDVATSLQD